MEASDAAENENAPNPSDQHRRLITVYQTLRFVWSFAFGAVATVRILHLEAIGISLAEIGTLMAVYSILLGVFEVPSGAAADVWGRRRVKLLSTLLMLVAFAAFASATGVATAGLALAILALARAMGSGADESWFVDEIGDSEHPSVLRGMARAAAASNVGFAVGALLGGGLPWLLTDSLDADRLFVPVFATAGFALVVEGAITARFMTSQAQVDRRDRRGVWQTTFDGVRMTLAEPIARWVATSFLVFGALNACVDLLAPLALSGHLGSDRAALWFGLLVATAWILQAYTAARTPVIERWAGSKVRAAGITLFVSVAATLPAALSAWQGPTWSYVGIHTFGGPVVVLLGVIIHRFVDSAHRSTAVSTLSLAVMAGGALGASLVAGIGRASVIVVGAAGLVCAISLIRESREDVSAE